MSAHTQGSFQPVKAAQGDANCSQVGFDLHLTLIAAVRPLDQRCFDMIENCLVCLRLQCLQTHKHTRQF